MEERISQKMIVIVLGMHRSGTSALAGLLHTNGINMGKKLLGPKPENPKGFFEDKTIIKLNDEILSYNNYKVTSWSEKLPSIITCSSNLKLKLSNYIKNRNENIWGWKDPRTCITFPIWKTIIGKKEYKVITIKRDIEAVAKSLYKRNNCSIEQGMKVARAYNKKISKIHKSLNISYENLINNTEDTVNKISEYLNYKISNISIVKKELNRNG